MSKKKAPHKWSTKEALKRLFPKKVVDKAKEIAHERDVPDGEPRTAEEPGDSDHTGRVTES
jgi:hypothetical protein